MLQRIQTLFLLLIAILSVVILFLPVQTITSSTETFVISLFGSHSDGIITSTVYLPIGLTLLITVLTLLTIFLYKNRILQMRMCSLIAILSFLLCAALLAPIYVNLKQPGELNVDYSFYTFLPALNIILAFIAKRFIKNDEELVRSADRIR